jgi:hypothetical protein
MGTKTHYSPLNCPIRVGDVELVTALRIRFGVGFCLEIDESKIPYLQGLGDAGVPGAVELISAIERYGIIEIKEL